MGFGGTGVADVEFESFVGGGCAVGAAKVAADEGEGEAGMGREIHVAAADAGEGVECNDAVYAAWGIGGDHVSHVAPHAPADQVEVAWGDPPARERGGREFAGGR